MHGLELGKMNCSYVLPSRSPANRVPDIRDELASEGAGAAGDTVAAQGTSEDWDGEGDPATMEIPNQSTMNRNQWKRFKERAKRLQGRK